MKAVEYHNANINNALKPGSLKNYFSTEKYLKQFLQERLKTDDIYLIQLNYKFIVNFENYIRTYQPKKARRTGSNKPKMRADECNNLKAKICSNNSWVSYE